MEKPKLVINEEAIDDLEYKITIPESIDISSCSQINITGFRNINDICPLIDYVENEHICMYDIKESKYRFIFIG